MLHALINTVQVCISNVIKPSYHFNDQQQFYTHIQPLTIAVIINNKVSCKSLFTTGHATSIIWNT